MITEANQNLVQMRDYYTLQRSTGGGEESIYAIWEKGSAFNDSVTPSTYVPEYRSHMSLKLLSLTQDGATVFSVGCGNAAVEGVIVGLGRTVRGIDFNQEAVELAREKGVDAFAADFYALDPSQVADADVLYADGFLGHLFDADLEVGPVLDKLVGLGLKSGAYVVLSNDAPQEAEVPFAAHQRVEDFWYLSKDYLGDRLAERGYQLVESYYFPYLRPISGMRNRTICIARVP